MAHWLIGPVINQLVVCLPGELSDWMIDRGIDWLLGGLADSCLPTQEYVGYITVSRPLCHVLNHQTHTEWHRLFTLSTFPLSRQQSSERGHTLVCTHLLVVSGIYNGLQYESIDLRNKPEASRAISLYYNPSLCQILMTRSLTNQHTPRTRHASTPSISDKIWDNISDKILLALLCLFEVHIITWY